MFDLILVSYYDKSYQAAFILPSSLCSSAVALRLLKFRRMGFVTSTHPLFYP
jgi:hypothetical protein